jgi:hypothetical protein
MDDFAPPMKCPAYFLPLALSLLLIVAGCGKRQPTKEEIFGTIQENVHALETKDVSTVMATIHPQSPLYANTKEAVQLMFANVDLKYTLSDLHLVSAAPEEMKVSFVQKTEKVGGKGTFVNNIVEGIHTLRPDGDRWKIYKTLETKITDLQGRPLRMPDAPALPVLPGDKLPPTPAAPAPAATPAPAPR